MQVVAFLALLVFSSLSFGYTFDPNVPVDVKNQMIADLKFIDTLQGGTSSQLHAKIFGNVDGPTYTKFFESRVTSIGLHTCGSANAVACVIPMISTSKMWITKNFIVFSHPQISRMMVVFHEARHTEVKNGFWSHATCPTPFLGDDGQPIMSIWTGANLAGEPACDVTPFGSYGSSMIMLKNVQKFCSNCTEKVKMDAGLYADDQFKRVTDAQAKAQIKADLYAVKNE